MAALLLRSSGRPHIDSTHLNPIVRVITWVLLATTTMALIFRLLTRCYLREKRNFAWEDGLILCSYVGSLRHELGEERLTMEDVHTATINYDASTRKRRPWRHPDWIITIVAQLGFEGITVFSQNATITN